MLKVPAGNFVREERHGSKRSVQKVTLTRDFYLADREVTVEQFQQFVSDTKHLPAKEREKWISRGRVRPSMVDPVQQISWFDAVLFCNWLSKKEGLIPCNERTGEKQEAEVGTSTQQCDAWKLKGGANGYRLPTEAEWEYACRAGTTTNFCYGDEEALLPEYGWIAVNSKSRVRPGGSKLCNAWGMFDMHGNCMEWCHDGHGVYTGEKAVDPVGLPTSRARVGRGGAYMAAGWNCCSWSRNGCLPMTPLRRHGLPRSCSSARQNQSNVGGARSGLIGAPRA
jgi:formylglycine-generating enzyme required for sulfatase activity